MGQILRFAQNDKRANDAFRTSGLIIPIVSIGGFGGTLVNRRTQTVEINNVGMSEGRRASPFVLILDINYLQYDE